ncbi:7212_t:CDS:1, partial [Funneliformis geosporum]
LNIPALFLEGSLDLSDFINLEILNCDENRITNFNTSKCYKLAVKEITDQLSTFLFHPDFTAKLQAE